MMDYAQKTLDFKVKIQENCASINEKIEALKQEVETSTDIDRNEEIYTEDRQAGMKRL